MIMDYKDKNLSELLLIVPHYIEYNNIKGVFKLQCSFSGKWHCLYHSIIGFKACETPEDAVKEVLKWVDNGMDVDKYLNK